MTQLSGPSRHRTDKNGLGLFLCVLAVCLVSVPTSVHAQSISNGFLSTNGTSIVDANGGPVLLRGADLWGYSFSQGYIGRHSEADYQTLKSWGFNVVRVTISWSNIEAKQGVYDDNYFSNYLDNDIQWAKKYGIYVVLDMQQVRWNWKFGGGGAPDWVVSQYPSNELGWQAAVANFWQNNTLWTSYANVWKHVASRYSNEQIVAGYDIMNEPYEMFPDYLSQYAADRWATVQAFHSFVINEIRKVDTNHIVFVEPFAMPVPPSAMALSVANVVWAPHFYAYASHINALVYDWHSVKSSSGLPYSHENVTQLESYFKSLYDTFVLRFNQPMWIAEFGMQASVQGADIWAKDSADLFNKYNVGWAWWDYWRSSSMEKNGKPVTTWRQTDDDFGLLDNNLNDAPRTILINALTMSTLSLHVTRRT